MTGPQFQRARLKLGLSQADIARLFRINESTIHRWERQLNLRIDPLYALLCQHLIWLSGAPDPLFFRDIVRWACRKDQAGFGLFVLLKIGYDDFDGLLTSITYAERVKAWAVQHGYEENKHESGAFDRDPE